jgi:IS1 family transposase
MERPILILTPIRPILRPRFARSQKEIRSATLDGLSKLTKTPRVSGYIGRQCIVTISWLSLWHDLRVKECQLDQLWSFVHTKERQLETAKYCCATYGDAWIWVAFAPVWRCALTFVVGKRTQTEATRLLERVVHVTDGHTPFFISDQLAEYRTALLHAYGEWQQPERQGTRSRFPDRRRLPRSDLLYAQVVKQREHGHMVQVSDTKSCWAIQCKSPNGCRNRRPIQASIPVLSNARI